MQYLAIATIIVFLAYSVSVGIKNQLFRTPKTENTSPMPVASISTSPNPISTVEPSDKPIVSPRNSPQPYSSSTSKIEIHTDLNTDKHSGDLIIYPGAIKTSDDNHYQTNDNGEAVYNWYKANLEKRSFQIRNNVKTKANDKFMAVLQGVSSTTSIKVTINQENSSAVTAIIIE
jgi:hypothetical protein